MKVGITGHQNIGSASDIEWTEQVLSAKIVEEHVTHGFTSLAVGADQLFAFLLEKQGLHYTVVVPCMNYDKTFKTAEDLITFLRLQKSAADVITLPFQEPSEEAFWAAGKKIVELSEIMVAIWNGLPAKGLGGTGDVVKYCLQIHRRTIHINPVVRQVMELSAG